MISLAMQPTFLVTGITTATPMVFTTPASHGLTTGDIVNILGVIGINAANREKKSITVISATTFRYTDSLGTSDTYVSGGVVSVPKGSKQFAFKSATERWLGDMSSTGEVIRLNQFPHAGLPFSASAVVHRLAIYQECDVNPDDANKEIITEVYGRVLGGQWVLAATIDETDTHVNGNGFFWFMKDCPAWPEMRIDAVGTPASTNAGQAFLIVPMSGGRGHF